MSGPGRGLPLGLVLAGGLSRRMGTEKAFVTLGGRPLVARVAARLAGQVAALALSANGDPARFAALGLPVLADAEPGFPGPVAGVLAGLAWAEARGAEALVTVPVDVPFLPLRLATALRMAAFAGGTGAAMAESGGPAGLRAHPAIALWPVAARGAVAARFAAGERRLSAVLGALSPARIAFEADPLDPFFNLNTPSDREAAERLLAEHGETGVR